MGRPTSSRKNPQSQSKALPPRRLTASRSGNRNHALNLEPLEDRNLLAVIVVDDLSQEVNSDSGTSLQEAIYSANFDSNRAIDPTNVTNLITTSATPGSGADTIVLQAGAVYQLSTFVADPTNPMGFTANPLIFSNITIEGNGATLVLVGATDVRALAVGSANVTFFGGTPDEVTFAGLGNLTLKNVYIKNFSTQGGNGADGGGGGLAAGAALYNNGGTVTIDNSTFDNNTATGGNGAANEMTAGGGGGGGMGGNGAGQGNLGSFLGGGGGGGARGNAGIGGNAGGGGGGTTGNGAVGGVDVGGNGGFDGGGKGGNFSVSGGTNGFAPGGGGGGGGGNNLGAGGSGGIGAYGAGGGGGGSASAGDNNGGAGGAGGFGGGGGAGGSENGAGTPGIGGAGGFGGGGGVGSTPGNGGLFGGLASAAGQGGGGGAALGAAIFNDSGTVVIRNSTFFGNKVIGGQAGGAGAAAGSANGTVFSRNGTLRIFNSTFSGATGSTDVAALGDGAVATLELRNNIIANNLSGNPNGQTFNFNGGSVTQTNSGNLVEVNGTNTASTMPLAGVVSTLDPLLQPLALNAPGNTPTMAIPIGSPAFNTADAVTSLATDQRGVPRPQDLLFDIGAFEVTVPVNICGDQQIANQDDQFLIIRDANDPSVVQVFVNGALNFTQSLATVLQINVFGAGGNDTLTVDSSNGLIDIPGGIRFDGDNPCPGQIGAGIGGFDRLDLRQTGGAVTDVSETLAVGAQPGSGRHSIVAPSGTQRVDFQNLEPVTSNVLAAMFNITSSPGLASLLAAANTINFSTGTLMGPAWGRVTIDNFEPIEFTNKTIATIDAGAGDDKVVVNNSNEPTLLQQLRINGDNGDDSIIVSNLPDAQTTTFVYAILSGGQGDDRIDGRTLLQLTPLFLNGNDGDDTLAGGASSDSYFGGAGDDTLTGSASNDSFDGGTGFDTVLFEGTGGNDIIDVFQAAPSPSPMLNYQLLRTLAGVTTTHEIFRTNPLLAPDDPTNAPTVEQIRIETKAGNDTIRVGHADIYTDPAQTAAVAAQMLRFSVDGGDPNASDRLIVRDGGLGDLVLVRQAATPGSGRVTVAPVTNTGLGEIIYEHVERVDVLRFDDITGLPMPAVPVPVNPQDFPSRIVVFQADPFEMNDSLPIATEFTDLATTHLNPNIDPGGDPTLFGGLPGDEDWYQFTPTKTSTYRFDVLFKQILTVPSGRPGLPGGGDLDIAIYDSAGAQIVAGADVANFGAQVSFSALGGKTYYLRVAGAPLGTASVAINTYNVAFVNVDTLGPVVTGIAAGDMVFTVATTDDKLRMIDPFSGATLSAVPITLAGQVVTGGTGISRNPSTGQLFALLTLNGQTSSQLVTINPVTGVATNVGDTGDVFADLAFNSGGVLYAVTDDGATTPETLYTLNTTNGSATQVTGLGNGNTGEGLAFDTTNGQLYHSSGQGVPNVDEILESIDPATLVVTPIALTGDNYDGVQGISYWKLLDRMLLADVTKQFYQIAADGVTQLIGTLDHDAAGFAFVDKSAFNLFDPKPQTNGPTPLITSLVIQFTDPVARAPGDLYPALDPLLANNPANYLVVGDANGIVGITSVVVINNPVVVGSQATATVRLQFAKPLSDDRFTVTLSDALTDPPGNQMDGENNAVQPLNIPQFPSGNGINGGNFVARFTVDSRPEIGVYATDNVVVDINGNNYLDLTNADATNRDLVFLFGVINDQRLAGKFFNPISTLPPPLPGTLFDVLVAYGRDTTGTFRFLIDYNGNGAVDPANGEIVASPQIDGLAAAGNPGGSPNGIDKLAIFDGTLWHLDVLGANTTVNAGITGYPLIGDFDGDGLDDLGTYRNNTFFFNFANDGFADAVDATLAFGAPGVLDRAVVGDLDQDGIDDLGIWVPDTGTTQGSGEWRFLMSDDFASNKRSVGTVTTLNHPFSPTPLGVDQVFRFGNPISLPLVGNFDPPVAAPALATVATVTARAVATPTQTAATTPKFATTTTTTAKTSTPPVVTTVAVTKTVATQTPAAVVATPAKTTTAPVALPTITTASAPKPAATPVVSPVTTIAKVVATTTTASTTPVAVAQTPPQSPAPTPAAVIVPPTSPVVSPAAIVPTTPAVPTVVATPPVTAQAQTVAQVTPAAVAATPAPVVEVVQLPPDFVGPRMPQQMPVFGPLPFAAAANAASVRAATWEAFVQLFGSTSTSTIAGIDTESPTATGNKRRTT